MPRPCTRETDGCRPMISDRSSSTTSPVDRRMVPRLGRATSRGSPSSGAEHIPHAGASGGFAWPCAHNRANTSGPVPGRASDAGWACCGAEPCRSLRMIVWPSWSSESRWLWSWLALGAGAGLDGAPAVGMGDDAGAAWAWSVTLLLRAHGTESISSPGADGENGAGSGDGDGGTAGRSTASASVPASGTDSACCSAASGPWSGAA